MVRVAHMCYFVPKLVFLLVVTFMLTEPPDNQLIYISFLTCIPHVICVILIQCSTEIFF